MVNFVTPSPRSDCALSQIAHYRMYNRGLLLVSISFGMDYAIDTSHFLFARNSPGPNSKGFYPIKYQIRIMDIFVALVVSFKRKTHQVWYNKQVDCLQVAWLPPTKPQTAWCWRLSITNTLKRLAPHDEFSFNIINLGSPLLTSPTLHPSPRWYPSARPIRFPIRAILSLQPSITPAICYIPCWRYPDMPHSR